MRRFLWAAATIAVAQLAAAENADDYRGGWRTGSGEAHTYEFSIRGTTVRGIYCTYCADAATLAFVDGSFGADGIEFVVTHVNVDGSTAFTDEAVARFSAGRLNVRGTSGAPGGGRFERVLIKDPRGPDPIPVPVSVLPPTGRPWQRMWLGFGVGAPKQFFIIKKVGDRLRGMVCGTCDNPYTMAALDDFRIQGDTLRFNILHEDWGDGPIPTFEKHVTAHIGWNEMRATTAADHLPAPPPRPVTPGFVPGFSLQGPIAIEATAGNVWPEWPPQGTSSPR